MFVFVVLVQAVTIRRFDTIYWSHCRLHHSGLLVELLSLICSLLSIRFPEFTWHFVCPFRYTSIRSGWHSYCAWLDMVKFSEVRFFRMHVHASRNWVAVSYCICLRSIWISFECCCIHSHLYGLCFRPSASGCPSVQSMYTYVCLYLSRNPWILKNSTCSGVSCQTCTSTESFTLPYYKHYVDTLLWLVKNVDLDSFWTAMQYYCVPRNLDWCGYCNAKKQLQDSNW